MPEILHYIQYNSANTELNKHIEITVAKCLRALTLISWHSNKKDAKNNLQYICVVLF